MFVQVNIHEAKTHLSRLVDRASAGEEIVIAKAGKAMAKLVPFEPGEPRRLGMWQGKVEILPGFDEIDEELADAFEGS